MYVSHDFTETDTEQYWTIRAFETELELSRATSDLHRTVYLELIGHYRRLASLRSMQYVKRPDAILSSD